MSKIENSESFAPESETNSELDSFEQTVVAIASSLHDNWRKDRLQEDGTYEPRVKEDGRGEQIDIANTSYVDLPEKWQSENKAAAETVVDLVHEANLKGIDIHSPEFLEAASDRVHIKWMERNPKEEWNATQHVPYTELPDEEKQKDREQVLLAIASFSKN